MERKIRRSFERQNRSISKLKERLRNEFGNAIEETGREHRGISKGRRVWTPRVGEGRRSYKLAVESEDSQYFFHIHERAPADTHGIIREIDTVWRHDSYTAEFSFMKSSRTEYSSGGGFAGGTTSHGFSVSERLLESNLKVVRNYRRLLKSI